MEHSGLVQGLDLREWGEGEMVMTGKQEGTTLATPQLDLPLQARPEAHRTLPSSHLLSLQK